MTHEEFMDLDLENINEFEAMLNFVNMFFDIKGFKYCLQVQLGDNTLRITNLRHFSDPETCPLCSNNRSDCTALEPYKEELFRRLVHSNELRLKWVTTREFNWD